MGHSSFTLIPREDGAILAYLVHLSEKKGKLRPVWGEREGVGGRMAKSHKRKPENVPMVCHSPTAATSDRRRPELL